MISSKLPQLFYGGDYNPEQWPEDVWGEDMRLMNEAGVNLVSIGVFSWALLEPKPGKYSFGWLDRIMNLLAGNGIFADLATATASPPAWLARAHPESLPQDANGTRLHPGSRQHYCPNSVAYSERATALVRAVAKRYAKHPALAMWHINNEYACHVAACYCDVCAAGFRRWLQARYGSLEELNARWGTAFWSQWYYDWEEILPPRTAPTYINPGQRLDYHRFMNDSILALCQAEKSVLKAITPGLPVTTNFMVGFKPLDYFRWGAELDFTCVDCYPDPSASAPLPAAWAAGAYDLTRSCGGGKPWILMEQVTSHVTWRTVNVPKPPGVMRLWSLQAVARGADGVMFFQWRQSRAGAEKFLGAMVPHAGVEPNRIFREVRELGRELHSLNAVAGTTVQPAQVAIIMDWASLWAVEVESKPRAQDYYGTIGRFHSVFFDANIPVDFTQPEADWLAAGYRFVVAPLTYVMSRTAAENIARFVEGGGVFLTTYFSGIVDENDRVHLGGYPALLREVLGLWIEEFVPLAEGGVVRLELPGKARRKTHGSLWTEVVHLTTAKALASYGEGMVAGGPAITRNSHGRGTAYYVSTELEPDFLATMLEGICNDLDIRAPLRTPCGIEARVRQGGSEEFLFLLNRNQSRATVVLKRWKNTEDMLTGQRHGKEIELQPNGVAVLSRSIGLVPA